MRLSCRVLLVDDHAMVRQALAQVLEDAGATVVAQVGSVAEGLAAIRDQRPDVVVLDYSLDAQNALTLLERMAASGLEARVLVLSVHESQHYAVRALEAGALGYGVKADAIDELVVAIQTVLRGAVYVTPRLAQPVLQALVRPRRERVGLDALSPRELELLRLLAGGATLTDAASTMGVGTSAASTYRARLLEKLGLGTTAELIRFALEEKLVT